ncbi:MAG: major facilitator superfamily domain-containing protein [Podila humilis]|nr:MAG: major facilitator superfamily domain-containing protein [Podila humilis]
MNLTHSSELPKLADTLYDEKKNDSDEGFRTMTPVDMIDAESDILNPMSDEIKRIRWKVDKRLIPMLALIYLCSYLDRANIGNAKVAGMETDLQLKPGRFNTALSIFYIGYVLGEIPANMALKTIGPRMWIPLVMLAWGGVMISMAAIKNESGLYAGRFFLGLAESGFAPGPMFVISIWYIRQEQAIRAGLFFSAATVAGAFGGVLAYGISHMDGVSGLRGWQWIFIIEGIPTLVMCVVAFFVLPDFPANAKFLTPAERDLTMKRLQADAGPANETEFTWEQFWAAFKDWKVYLHMSIGFFHAIPHAALGLSIPSIVEGFNFDHVTTQIMTAPVYVVACLFTLAMAHSSDKRKERGYHATITILVSIAGYLLLVLTRNASTAARYISLMICTSGNFAFTPVALSWPSANIGGHTKRGVALAMIISFAQIGSAIGGQLYRDDDAPTYKRGHLMSVGCLAVDILLVLLMKRMLVHENNRRELLTPEQFEKECSQAGLADRHPDFRYYS